jgi:sulfatase maturation enzyme AslB (radical SAM superfamily)
MPGNVTADAGYGSEQNYQFLEENFIRAFVKDPYFDKDQHDKAKKNPFGAESLYYNEAMDCYYCLMGQPMKQIGDRTRTRYDGMKQTYARYQAQNCQGCPLLGMCNKTTYNRILVETIFIVGNRQQQDRYQSPQKQPWLGPRNPRVNL